MAESSPSGTPAPTGRDRSFTGTLDRMLEPLRNVWRRAGDAVGGIRPNSRIQRTKFVEPRVFFVDVGNSARSQMCEAFAWAYGLHAESAGTFPVHRLPEEVVQAMHEIGMDISGFRTKPLDTNRLEAFDRVININEALPKHVKAKLPNAEDWNLVDPAGLPLDAYRRLRNDIEKRIRKLADQEFRLQKAKEIGKVELPTTAGR